MAKKAVQRALILQGGGALGAYEAGVIRALARKLTDEDEKNGHHGERPLFDIVAGASIGALNATILVCDVLNRMKEKPRPRQFWTSRQKAKSATGRQGNTATC